MRANLNVMLMGKSVVLVPYRKEHVPLYHSWMKDAELQQATASEPLTEEAEYEMQCTWSEDEDKCTFILLDRSLPDSPGTGEHGGAMAGDVNFFRNDPDEDPGVVELEVMVAEQASRRKGLACEALQIFMTYAHAKLAVHTFRVKIGDDNLPSLALFRRLGFVQIGHSHIFEETELELSTRTVEGAAQSEHVQALHRQAADLQYGEYDPLVQEPL